MSRKKEFLAKADEVAALAERVRDPMTKRSLAQAVDCWRMMAAMEDELTGPLAPWPVRGNVV